MPKLSPNKLNTYLFLKLPSAWFSGVRVQQISPDSCITRVRHRWINQNPFGSLYFAVQAMAAELSTGTLVMQAIQRSQQPVSMLVARNTSHFTRKARGIIQFECQEGEKVNDLIAEAIRTGEGHTFWMRAVGVNEAGEQVSVFEFEWTVKLRSSAKTSS